MNEIIESLHHVPYINPLTSLLKVSHPIAPIISMYVEKRITDNQRIANKKLRFRQCFADINRERLQDTIPGNFYQEMLDSSDINYYNGWTPLAWACANNLESVAIKFMNIGAIINPPGANPLEWAIHSNNYKLVKILLDSGAYFDYEKDKSWRPHHHDRPIPSSLPTSLISAVRDGRDDSIIAELISRGSNVNYINENGNTLLHLATEIRYDKCKESIASLLINAGIDINIKNSQGLTALSYAIKNSHDSVILLLLREGANVSKDCEEELKLAKKEHEKRKSSSYMMYMFKNYKKNQLETIKILENHQKWMRIKLLYLMKPYNDHETNKSHRLKPLGKLLTNQVEDYQTDFIVKKIASYLV